MRNIARSGLLASALLALVACGPICGFGASLSLSHAHVDATYTCPYPANDLPYQVHANIDAKNSSFSSVDLKSIQETWTNVGSHGNWSGGKGTHGTDSITKYSPKSIGAGASIRPRLTTNPPWAENAQLAPQSLLLLERPRA